MSLCNTKFGKYVDLDRLLKKSQGPTPEIWLKAAIAGEFQDSYSEKFTQMSRLFLKNTKPDIAKPFHQCYLLWVEHEVKFESLFKCSDLLFSPQNHTQRS